MLSDTLPEPSKRSFGFPLPVRALDYFVHPGGKPSTKVFQQPFEHHGSVYASNGWLAIVAHRYDGLPPADCPEAFERLRDVFPLHGGHHVDYVKDCEKLGTLPLRKDDWERRWRPLDDAALQIWKRGPLPPFDFAQRRWWLRRDPVVRVGAATHVPLPLIQLLARLPRAAVWIENTATGRLLCRFNGGMAVVGPCFGTDPLKPPNATFSILAPRTDAMSQSHTF